MLQMLMEDSDRANILDDLEGTPIPGLSPPKQTAAEVNSNLLESAD